VTPRNKQYLTQGNFYDFERKNVIFSAFCRSNIYFTFSRRIFQPVLRYISVKRRQNAPPGRFASAFAFSARKAYFYNRLLTFSQK